MRASPLQLPVPANPVGRKSLQARLRVGASNDPLEREADRVAEQVLSADRRDGVQRTGPHIQRFAPQNSPQTQAAPAIVDRVLASPGSPLGSGLRQDMEQRFGHDFSRVRVHADDVAERSAQDLHAEAYTVGERIVFGAGRFSPDTQDGRRLLAHELTHVVQQSGSVAATIQRQAKSPPSQTPIMPCRCLAKPKHPEKVSQRMIDGWKGLRAKEGEQGEGCIGKPYVAGRGEKVCTIGYGHQIPGCTVVNQATGQAPTDAERKDTEVALGCACAGSVSMDCKGPEAEQQLLQDARVGEKWVRKVVTVDLDQAQFDALVDITLHVGSIPKTLLDAVNLYGCSPGGWNKVREIYLTTALTPQGSKKVIKGFVSRRQHRVWPVAQ